MSQLFAADRTEQPLTPDTPVTTASLDHLEIFSQPSIVDVSRCKPRIFRHPERRHTKYPPTDTVRARDVQCRPV
jgi:hypothetical protein